MTGHSAVVQESELVLLDVGIPGNSLALSIRPYADLLQSLQPWYHMTIRVEAAPFAGTLETTFTRKDLHLWAEQLRLLAAPPARAVLGGDRALELVLECEKQIGGPDGADVLEVQVTPSGDDPYPWLRYLIFDVQKAWEEVAAAVSLV